MWSDLQRLAAVCTGPTAGPDDIVEACGIIAHALRAEDAYVIRAGDPAFIRIGCPCDPVTYELKQKGYWLVWREAATHTHITAGLVNVADRLVTSIDAIGPHKPATHIGAILPADESNSELLFVRGPWPQGLTAEQVAFLDAARPILGHLVSSVLDADRRARQRQQLESLANVADAFNNAHDADDVLVALATALATASAFDWVTITVYNDACDRIVDSAMNRARHSETRIAASYRDRGDGDVAAEVQFGIDMAERDQPVLVPDVFDSSLVDRPDVSAISGAIPALQAFWTRAHVLSVAMLPMVFHRKPLGFISFSSSTRREFNEAEVAFLQALTTQAATAIKGLRLYEDLQASREELHRREEWFRSLVQHSSDLITVIEPDTTVLYQSPAIARVLGYEVDSIVGQKLVEGIHREDVPSFLAALGDLMTKPGEVVVGEGRVRARCW